MKHIILLVAFIGLIQPATWAQSAYNKNYKVCIVDNKYKVCHHQAAGVHYTHKALQKNKAVVASLRKKDIYVHAGHRPAKQKNSKLKVTYNDAADAYRGESSLINDGVKKNEYRNLNYQNAAANLPANNGSK